MTPEHDLPVENWPPLMRAVRLGWIFGIILLTALLTWLYSDAFWSWVLPFWLGGARAVDLEVSEAVGIAFENSNAFLRLLAIVVVFFERAWWFGAAGFFVATLAVIGVPLKDGLFLLPRFRRGNGVFTDSNKRRRWGLLFADALFIYVSLFLMIYVAFGYLGDLMIINSVTMIASTVIMTAALFFSWLWVRPRLYRRIAGLFGLQS